MVRLWLLVWCLLSAPLRAEPVDSLRSPLPASHLTDTLGLLASDTRAELDRLAGTLDGQNRGQLAFVVVSNTDGMDPRQYGMAVFNRWGVGDRQRNDGLLILLARDDRAAEILLGDGIDTAANRAQAQAVMDQEMVPRLRGRSGPGLCSRHHGPAAAHLRGRSGTAERGAGANPQRRARGDGHCARRPPARHRHS